MNRDNVVVLRPKNEEMLKPVPVEKKKKVKPPHIWLGIAGFLILGAVFKGIDTENVWGLIGNLLNGLFVAGIFLVIAWVTWKSEEAVITQTEAAVSAIKPGSNGWVIELFLPEFDKFLSLTVPGKADFSLKQRMNILVRIVRKKHFPEKISSVTLESLFSTSTEMGANKKNM
jgi:hypothetical protein